MSLWTETVAVPIWLLLIPLIVSLGWAVGVHLWIKLIADWWRNRQ